MKQERHTRTADQEGFSLVEVMVAAVVLMLVFFGVAQVVSLNRSQLLYEQDHRIATEVAQARLESLRKDYRHVDLATISGVDTTYVVDGRTFTVNHVIRPDTPEARATTVQVTVNWVAQLKGAGVNRSLSCTTILGRSTP